MTKRKTLNNGKVRVTFTLPADFEATGVSIVGDFNNWNPESLPMKRRKSGSWRASLDLEAEREYQFLYLTDGGTFLTEEHCAACPNPFGGQNSLLTT